MTGYQTQDIEAQTEELPLPEALPSTEESSGSPVTEFTQEVTEEEQLPPF